MCVVALGTALAPALGISLGTGAAATTAATSLGMAAISTGLGVASAGMQYKAAKIWQHSKQRKMKLTFKMQ